MEARLAQRLVMVLHFKAFYSPVTPNPPGEGCMLALDDSLKELAANPTRGLPGFHSAACAARTVSLSVGHFR